VSGKGTQFQIKAQHRTLQLNYLLETTNIQVTLTTWHYVFHYDRQNVWLPPLWRLSMIGC